MYIVAKLAWYELNETCLFLFIHTRIQYKQRELREECVIKLIF